MADDFLAVLRGEHALHGGLDILDSLVDDAVQADLYFLLGRRVAGASVGTDIEADDDRAEGRSQVDVVLGDRADGAVQDLYLDLVVAELLQRLLHSLDRALHVGLDDQVQVLELALVDAGEQVIQRNVGGGGAGGAHLFAALVGHLAAQAVVLDGHHIVARLGHFGKARDLHRHGGAGFLHALAAVVEQGADAAEGHAGHDIIAHVQGAVFEQHGGKRAAVLVQLGFDDDAAGHAVGVGAQLHGVGLQQNHFQQVVHAFAGDGADGRHDGIAAPFLGHQVVIGQVLLHAVGIGGLLVHLVDGNDDRHARRLGMVDGFHGLGHDAVVGRHDQHGDVGRLRAAGAHGGEGLVAGRIQEGDLTSVHIDGVRADMLGDAAGFARGHMRLADVVQQRGLAVVDVAHDGDDGRAGLQVFFLILHVLLGQGVLGRAGKLHFERDAELAAHKGGGIVIQLAVDVGHDAQQQQLFEDLARGLADALGQVLDRDGLGGHDGLVDHDGRHHLLGAHLLLAAARALAAADDLVVHAAVEIGVFLGELLAALRHALGIMLALVLFLVGIVIAYALLLHHGSELGARAALGTSALGTASLLALRAVSALGTAAEAALALLTGTLLIAALLALRTPALLTLGTRSEIALALRTGTVHAGALLIAALLALRTPALLALRTRGEIALALRTGRGGTRLRIGAGLALLRDGLTPGQHAGRGTDRGARGRRGSGGSGPCGRFGLGRGGLSGRRRLGSLGGPGRFRARSGLGGLGRVFRFLFGFFGRFGGGSGRRRFSLNGLLSGGRFKLFIIGHSPCLGMLLGLQAFLGFLLLAHHLHALALQLLQQLLGAAADPRGFLQNRVRFLIEFLGCFLQLNLRHSTLAPPDFDT